MSYAFDKDSDTNTIRQATSPMSPITAIHTTPNRMINVDGGATATYTYDAFGGRVRLVNTGRDGLVNYYRDCLAGKN